MCRFLQMVLEAVDRPPHLRLVPRWGISLACLPLRSKPAAMKEQLYQSERPWESLNSTKFERTLGWGATPLQDAVAATVGWFREHR